MLSWPGPPWSTTQATPSSPTGPAAGLVEWTMRVLSYRGVSW
jgi:hypothetical protein